MVTASVMRDLFLPDVAILAGVGKPSGRGNTHENTNDLGQMNKSVEFVLDEVRSGPVT